MTRYEEDDPRLHYTGDWIVSTNAAHSGGTAVLSSGIPGDTVTFEFEGDYVRWIGLQGGARGIGWIYVDDLPRVEIDQYGSTEFQKVLHEVTGLGPGRHRAAITNTGAKHASSGSVRLEVDAIEVETLLDPPSTVAFSRFEEDDAGLIFTDDWAFGNNGARSGGAYSFSQGGDMVAVFEGPRFRWIGTVGPGRGIGSVSINGSAPVEVDLYRPDWLFRQMLYDSDLHGLELGDGPNVAVLTPIGDKNPDSSSNIIEFDALEAVGLQPAARFEAELAEPWKYTYGWLVVEGADYSGGSTLTKWSGPLGHTLRWAFEGPFLRVFTLQGSSRGAARLFIDNVDYGLVDSFSPSWTFQARTFETYDLGPGLHVARLEHQGDNFSPDCIEAASLVPLPTMQAGFAREFEFIPVQHKLVSPLSPSGLMSVTLKSPTIT